MFWLIHFAIAETSKENHNTRRAGYFSNAIPTKQKAQNSFV